MPRNSLVLYVVLVFMLFARTTGAQPADSPWFGLDLPPGIGNPHAPTVNVSMASSAPVAVPGGEEGYRALRGEQLLTYVHDIVDFSRQSRVEGNRVWGRVTGFPSARHTIDWTAERFREAGLEQVAVQEYLADEPMWWAWDWEVRLPGNDAFGEGSEDIILESALPTGQSFIDQDSLGGPLVATGHISTPIPAIDLQGKVAVQQLTPETGAYSERTATRERAQQLIARGAIAVINIVEQLGNMHTRDFARCNGPCFNVGTADGEFLLAAMEAAGAAGASESLQLRLSLDAEMLGGLSGHNAVGIVPARNGDSRENIIINAHADGWYDAAGDNADGLAVLVGMAEHFAENPVSRNLVFVASGGHHSRGLNGPANFVRMNPEVLDQTVLIINLEHVAQFAIDSSDWSVGPGEQAMNFSITNGAAYLINLTREGIDRYGFNLNPEFRTRAPGDLGGYRPLGLPMVQAIHSGPMYHASGDVAATISGPGLERAARFFSYFVSQAASASRSQLNP